MDNKQTFQEIENLAHYLDLIIHDAYQGYATPKQASTAIIKTVSEILDYVIQLKE